MAGPLPGTSLASERPLRSKLPPKPPEAPPPAAPQEIDRVAQMAQAMLERLQKPEPSLLERPGGPTTLWEKTLERLLPMLQPKPLVQMQTLQATPLASTPARRPANDAAHLADLRASLSGRLRAGTDEFVAARSQWETAAKAHERVKTQREGLERQIAELEAQLSAKNSHHSPVGESTSARLNRHSSSEFAEGDFLKMDEQTKPV